MLTGKGPGPTTTRTGPTFGTTKTLHSQQTSGSPGTTSSGPMAPHVQQTADIQAGGEAATPREISTTKTLREPVGVSANPKTRGFDAEFVLVGFLIARTHIHLAVLGLAYAWLREEVTPLTVEGILFPT